MLDELIVNKVSNTLVSAGSTFLSDKKEAYRIAIENETCEQAKWVMEQIVKNAEASERNRSPLCDDSGIPHLVLEIGSEVSFNGDMIESIHEGIRRGLRKLPGRPMAVKGDDLQRIDQSCGLYDDPAALETAPILIRNVSGNTFRLNILMFGGGSAIRAKTYRVFHMHSTQAVIDEIVSWAAEATDLLGCTPCTLAVGIGRSHYEAASMMLLALVDGRYDISSDTEREITERLNAIGKGVMGLGGNTSVLATFLKVGPQRASGVRIVCMRPCCCFEPRIASVDLL